MFDPRKPVNHPTGEAAGDVREIARQHLLKATENGAKDIGCTGASFVMVGLGIWTSELMELDARATSQLMHALAVFADPSANQTKKMHAERKRAAAVRKLFAALDIEMAPPAGTA
tara:strand:+ start:520 stop:864 length:345 start_codon:yes stop_codon:yes gene_type:complete